MKTITQILIVLLLITQNLGQDADTLASREIIAEITSENTLKNDELEAAQLLTTENSLINEVMETTSEVSVDYLEIKDETTTNTTRSLSDNDLYSEHDKVSEDCNKLESQNVISFTENKVYSEQEIVAEVHKKIDNEKAEVSEISLSENEVYTEPEIIPKDSNMLESGKDVATEICNKTETTKEEIVSNISNKAEIEELPTILKVLQPITTNQEEIKDISEMSGETVSKNEEIEDNSENLAPVNNSNTAKNEELPKILTDFKPVTNIQEELKDISEKSTETFIITSKQEEIEDNSTESLTEDSTTTVDYEETPKPLTTLEHYALKQMNFILDNLLIETQEFIATVLQASIHAVFQRDHLKRYAEGLNRILNPNSDSEYSDEIIEETKIMTQDELYEEIILKLKFLKSKPTRYLQRHLPQDWINDYLNKRAELTIWLDKACEQMHHEFNQYVSEEEDHIKYQYFNEAFDDISRATEIHQKLALLADLVKIVKNKKQITFMDLYMQ